MATQRTIGFCTKTPFVANWYSTILQLKGNGIWQTSASLRYVAVVVLQAKLSSKLSQQHNHICIFHCGIQSHLFVTVIVLNDMYVFENLPHLNTHESVGLFTMQIAISSSSGCRPTCSLVTACNHLMAWPSGMRIMKNIYNSPPKIIQYNPRKITQCNSRKIA